MIDRYGLLGETFATTIKNMRQMEQDWNGNFHIFSQADII